MPEELTGNPATFPATVRAPVAGDLRKDTSVKVGLSQLADRTAYLKAHRVGVQQFTSDGTWTKSELADANTIVEVRLVGGGGGGGGTPESSPAEAAEGRATK